MEGAGGRISPLEDVGAGSWGEGGTVGLMRAGVGSHNQSTGNGLGDLGRRRRGRAWWAGRYTIMDIRGKVLIICPRPHQARPPPGPDTSLSRVQTQTWSWVRRVAVGRVRRQAWLMTSDISERR